MLRILAIPLLALGAFTAFVEIIMALGYLLALAGTTSKDVGVMNKTSDLLTSMTGLLEAINNLMQTSVGAAFVVTGIPSAYFVPWLVALIRRRDGTGSVFVINLFLGWTFVGWVIALAMAVSGKARVELPPPPIPLRR